MQFCLKYIILIGFLVFGCFIAPQAQAQISAKGYRGKRFYVNYDLYTNPNLSHFNYSGKTGFLAWNTRHYLGGTYVVGRNKELSLQAGWHRTGLSYNFSYGLNNVSENRSETYNSFGFINGLDFQFTYKVFKFRKKGVLAPVGPYFGIGLVFGTYTITDDLMNAQPELVTHLGRNGDPGTASVNFINYGLKMDFGVQRIIAERFILKYSLQWLPLSTFSFYSGNSVGSLFDAFPKSMGDVNGAGELNEEMKTYGANRVQLNMIFSLNIGIGYLLF